jgi:predicted acylesterase/phospholipase RssA
MRQILSIDGGGIKGVFPAAFLASIEESLRLDVGEYFDLIVGTSTGGVLALGLGAGMSARQLLEFYEQFGPGIFAGNGLSRWLRKFRFAKYDRKPLHDALSETFGERRLGESRTRLVIPSVNLLTGEVHIYKTAHHSRLATDYREKLVDVAMATSAAPTFFPTHISPAGVSLIDGGTYANNPVGLAVVEAVTMLNWNVGEFRVLSLGCTESPLNVEASGRFGEGQLFWMTRIVDVMLKAQSSLSLGTAQHLGGHDKVWRINPVVPASRYALDATDRIVSLKGLGYSEARISLEKLRSFFLSKAQPFDPSFTLV